MAQSRTFIDDLYSKEVNYTEEFSKTQVIPNGKTMHITQFSGSAVNKGSILVKLIWDHGGAGEEILISGSSSNIQHSLSIQRVGDGVKKIALVLYHNNSTETDPVGLSASLKGYYV